MREKRAQMEWEALPHCYNGVFSHTKKRNRRVPGRSTSLKHTTVFFCVSVCKCSHNFVIMGNPSALAEQLCLLVLRWLTLQRQFHKAACPWLPYYRVNPHEQIYTAGRKVPPMDFGSSAPPKLQYIQFKGFWVLFPILYGNIRLFFSFFF